MYAILGAVNILMAAINHNNIRVLNIIAAIICFYAIYSRVRL